MSVASVAMAIGVWALGAVSMLAGGFVFWWIAWGWEKAWERFVSEKAKETIALAIAVPLFVAALTIGVWAIGDGILRSFQDAPSSTSQQGE